MPPTTVVTGAAGRIGRGVSASLRALGHRVVGIDVLPPPSEPLPVDSYVQCDLAAAAGAGAAQEALAGATAGAHAVVHCSAWPGPSATPPPAVVASGAAAAPAIGLEPAPPAVLLRDNVAATSAVVDAAVAGGAARVVFSSSAFAFGYGHAASGPQAFSPRYLPVDEAHGATPLESYGLSKLMGEEVLETAARTARATSFVSLRFTNIVKREAWGDLPWAAPSAAAPLPLILWAYVFEDDVIAAHVAAVARPDAAAAGTHETYIVAAPDTRFAEPTLDLLAERLGLRDLPLRAPMEGNASPLCAAKLTARLGVRPRSWRDETPAAPPPPRARGSPAAWRALADPRRQSYSLEGFELGCGEALPPGAALAYVVVGKPLGEGERVILHPSSFDAVHVEMEHQVGPGLALDTDRHTVILTNQLGNGVSFSPSTHPHARYPTVTIADNVRAQRALLDALGVREIDLIYGYSMGALQAFEWAVAYPDAVARVVAVCGAARCGPLNRVFLNSLEAILDADGAGGVPGPPRRGLTAFATVYAGWGVGADWYIGREYERHGFADVDDFVARGYLPGFAHGDADDLLAQVRAWKAADVAAHAGGDFAAALRRVTARVIHMPCASDRYFTKGEAAAEVALLPNAELRPIESPFGHRAGDPWRPEQAAEREAIRSAVHGILE